MYGGTPHRRTADTPRNRITSPRIYRLGMRSSDLIAYRPLIPTIEFCKEIVGLGGRLSIHSGTKPEIVSTLLDHKDISDLFDVIVSSNKTNKPDGGYTRYKKRLLSRLMDHYEHPESREYSEPRAQGHHDHNDDGGSHH